MNVASKPPHPELPNGVDDEEYRRIRRLMRVSVLGVWRGKREVIAGIDPWEVVDEAWSSMAQSGFKCDGPFVQFALRVAMNKARDALKRAEVKRIVTSLDAPLANAEHNEGATVGDRVAGSDGADEDYFRALDQIAATKKLALTEEAIYSVLTEVERYVFLGIRRDGKSGAAVGRELVPQLSGQRIGQIVARALMKIRAYIEEHPSGMNEGEE